MDGSPAPGSGSRLQLRGVGRARPSRDPRRIMIAFVALALAGSAQATHVVAPGESLSKIAKRYGTTPLAISQANHIPDPNLIVIGQHLTIPKGAIGLRMTPVAHSTAWSGRHVVRPGENLTRIATRYGTTVATIGRVNGVRNTSLIRVGATLSVPAPRPLTVEELLTHYGREFRVDPALVKALAWQESGWKQHVVSSAGAIGVMQLLPETAGFTGRHLLGTEVDVNDVDHNVKAGVRFLSYLLAQTKGDERLAVAAYFQGLRSVRASGVTPKTERYVANVLALKKRFAS